MAAYQPVGATSLAASYVNKQNPGTYDAAPGTAPTFAPATGWTFNGTTHYLTTGITPANNGTWTFLARWSGTSGDNRTLLGYYNAGGGAMLISSMSTTVSTYSGADFPAGIASNSPQLTAGVYGFAGKTPYRNGTAESTAIPAGTGSAATILLGALNLNGSSVIQRFVGDIQAIAIYSATLTAGEVATVSAAMAALPVSATGLPIIAAHYSAIFGG